MIKIKKNNIQVLLIFKFDYHNHMPNEILREIDESNIVYDVNEHNNFKFNIMKHPLKYLASTKRNKKNKKLLFFDTLLLMIAIDITTYDRKRDKSYTKMFKTAVEVYDIIKNNVGEEFLSNIKIDLIHIKYQAGLISDQDYFFPIN